MSVGRQEFIAAALNGNAVKVDQYISQHAADLASAINYRCKSTGSTALGAAARHGYQEIIDKLIAAHADVNIATNYGATPLMRAVMGNHLHIVSRLLAAHADIHKVTDMGTTALQFAELQHNDEIISLIVGAMQSDSEIDIDSTLADMTSPTTCQARLFAVASTTETNTNPRRVTPRI